MNIKSPLTKTRNTVLEETIASDFIIKAYSKGLNLDVSRFFEGRKTVNVYRCTDTGYRFYYPFEIDGDGRFYEFLEQYDWYYMDWKWEHECTLNLINHTDKVLEVGAARGSFLKRLSEIGIDCIGLELNKKAIKESERKGVKIFEETIQEYSKKHIEKYDLVCSFQVLEHIHAVSDFIQSQIDCLKPGGKLVISVPNNRSFINFEKGGLLNLPPHHMGLWDKDSLKKLEDVFSIKLETILFEPLQAYHYNWYVRYLENRLLPNVLFKKIFHKLQGPKLLMQFVPAFAKSIKGHSVMAIYIKL